MDRRTDAEPTPLVEQVEPVDTGDDGGEQYDGGDRCASSVTGRTRTMCPPPTCCCGAHQPGSISLCPDAPRSRAPGAKPNAPRGLRTGLGVANLSHTPGGRNDRCRPCIRPDSACSAATPRSGSPRPWPSGPSGPSDAPTGSLWRRADGHHGRGPSCRADAARCAGMTGHAAAVMRARTTRRGRAQRTPPRARRAGPADEPT